MSTVNFEIVARGHIESVHDFLRVISQLHESKSDHKLWYRGLSDCGYDLVPSVGRKHRYAGKVMPLTHCHEKWFLHRFRRRAYPLIGRAITAGEAIFLARHHKLPTRLLDWTANPLYALYFACTADQEKSGKLWAMQRHPGTEEHDLDAFKIAGCEDEDALFKYLGHTDPTEGQTRDSIRLVYPFYNSPRILAQDGAFTVHSDPRQPLESYAGKEFMLGRLDIERLHWWCVPDRNKVGLIKELSSLGITERLVYPDLDGIAKSLWETEVLWNGEPSF